MQYVNDRSWNSFLSKPLFIKLLALVLLVMGCNLSGLANQAAYAADPVTYYVSPTGQNANGYGTSPSTPYRTIQYAADRTNAGDTVYIMNGTYNETSGEAVFKVTRSGAPNAYITYKAYPGHTPKLSTSTAWNHIVISSASYIRIEGLEIEGNNANLSVSAGQARYDHYMSNVASGTVDWNYMAPTNTNGIYIKPTNVSSPNPHHIVIAGNKVHKTPGGGIVAEEADYITIENNTVFDTSWYNIYATSGISVFHSYNSDTNTTSYKNIVRNNRVYNNKTFIMWAKNQIYSDGNGIIIDDNKNTQLNGRLAPYTGKTLVTNNLVYLNGGSGIHSYSSANVDIINNSSYQNSSQLDYGEIYAQDSTNVNLYNNILYARTGKKMNPNLNNSNVSYNYNVYYNAAPTVTGANDIVRDPLYSNAGTGDFTVQSGSPAIDTGTTTLAPTNDLIYKPRPKGAAVDRGAYESQNLIGNPSFEWGSTGSWTKEQNAAGITVTNTGVYGGQYKAAYATTAATRLSQTVWAPETKTYTVTAYIITNTANVKLGVDVGGSLVDSRVVVADGSYKKVTFTFNAAANQSIKVWVSAPQAQGGWVGLDDVSVN